MSSVFVHGLHVGTAVAGRAAPRLLLCSGNTPRSSHLLRCHLVLTEVKVTTCHAAVSVPAGTQGACGHFCGVPGVPRNLCSPPLLASWLLRELSTSLKQPHWEFNQNCIQSVNDLGMSGHLYPTEPPNPRILLIRSFGCLQRLSTKHSYFIPQGPYGHPSGRLVVGFDPEF